MYTADATITSVLINNEGDGAFFKTDSGIYYYNAVTNSVRKLNLSATSTLYNVVGNNKIIVLDTDLYIYDTVSDNKEKIYAGNLSGFRVDQTGNMFIYSTSTGIEVLYRDAGNKMNKYLLSFDGKNSWYSYKSGTWIAVCKNATPSVLDFERYGMKEEEINALAESDFVPLYGNGKEIYFADIAIYFNSISPYITPSISSINIITDKAGFGLLNNSTTVSLYAAKDVEFNALQWRKVSRLYPVEISPRESEFIYFLFADGKYQYYDGLKWCIEENTEIADLINDIETNWISLKQTGMTAQRLREIPASVLTSSLAKKSFSVVYCMKVADESTTGYYSKISADYIKELFDDTKTLTINIKLNDGASMSISNLTNTQIEDFMEWLNSSRPNDKGSAYYSIKSGSTTYFINYYMILSVTVEES